MMVEKKLELPEFAAGLEGELLMDEPMSKHTSWRTGGNADYFYTPGNREDLLQLLSRLPSTMPVTWVGLGSNLLVRDGGIRGMVVRTSKGLNEIRMLDGNRIYAESGVSSAKVARFSSNSNLTGVEFLSGVPGSFGGALAMNAGAFGGETWDWVEDIECASRTGQCVRIVPGEILVGYRSVILPPDSWIISGTLALQGGGEDFNGRARIRSLLDKRSASQPIQSANAGSVFRNPEGDFAARLIEQAGLKGFAIGDAVVSKIHANFIVNSSAASSGQIEELINTVQEKVKDLSGVHLETEVRIIGEQA